MTDDEIRIAVAEECGLTKTTECPDCYGTGYTGSEVDHDPCALCNQTGKVEPYFDKLPDYPHDLNAMSDAVLSQSLDFQDEFQSELNNTAFIRGKLFCQLIAIDWARTFLRVRGKWRETK